MSDTPRTDEFIRWGNVPADFARQLERELSLADFTCKALLEKLHATGAELDACKTKLARAMSLAKATASAFDRGETLPKSVLKEIEKWYAKR